MLSTRVGLHFLGMSVCKTYIELRKGSAASQIRLLYFYFIRLPAERWRAQISDWVRHDRNGASNDSQRLVGASDCSISREKGRKGERRAPVVHSACGKQLATWYRLRGYKPQHEGTAKRKKKKLGTDAPTKPARTRACTSWLRVTDTGKKRANRRVCASSRKTLELLPVFFSFSELNVRLF